MHPVHTRPQPTLLATGAQDTDADLLMIRLEDITVTAGVFASEILSTASDFTLGDTYAFDTSKSLLPVVGRNDGAVIHTRRATRPCLGAQNMMVHTQSQLTLLSQCGHLVIAVMGLPQISPSTPVVLLPIALKQQLSYDLIAMQPA